jgi:hypothetical protein
MLWATEMIVKSQSFDSFFTVLRRLNIWCSNPQKITSEKSCKHTDTQTDSWQSGRDREKTKVITPRNKNSLTAISGHLAKEELPPPGSNIVQ